MWKQKLCTPPEPPSLASLVPVVPSIASFDTMRHLPTVSSLETLPQPLKESVNIDATSTKWMLNTEQTRCRAREWTLGIFGRKPQHLRYLKTRKETRNRGRLGGEKQDNERR